MNCLPNTSQQADGKCPWCKGLGWLLVNGVRSLCPKCKSTGEAPKTTTK